MNSGISNGKEPQGHRSMTFPTIAVILEILVNCAIVWYLLIELPAGCVRLAAETAGRQTCGLEAGGYVVAGISIILILSGACFLVKWYLPRQS